MHYGSYIATPPIAATTICFSADRNALYKYPDLCNLTRICLIADVVSVER